MEIQTRFSVSGTYLPADLKRTDSVANYWFFFFFFIACYSVNNWHTMVKYALKSHVTCIQPLSEPEVLSFYVATCIRAYMHSHTHVYIHKV